MEAFKFWTVVRDDGRSNLEIRSVAMLQKRISMNSSHDARPTPVAAPYVNVTPREASRIDDVAALARSVLARAAVTAIVRKRDGAYAVVYAASAMASVIALEILAERWLARLDTHGGILEWLLPYR